MSTTAESQVKAKYQVTSLDELEPYPQQEGRQRMRVRSSLGIEAFGVNAYGATDDGVQVIGEHDESRPWANQHEELYVVVSGRATFTVDGEEIDAPAGTLVFVADPAATRAAVAREAGTQVIAIGGRPGEAYRISVGEAAYDWYGHYQAKEYERGLEILEATLADYPANPFLFYNMACCESLLGRTDEALEHLETAVAGYEPFRELAREDSDLDAVRDDPRFGQLIA
jgi:mannose-6-phosphate isomerase-like protein (cupin superfamily)